MSELLKGRGYCWVSQIRVVWVGKYPAGILARGCFWLLRAVDILGWCGE